MSKRRSSKRRRKRRIAKGIIRFGIIALLVVILFSVFTLENVTTKGNVHESADDIVALACERPIAGNTLLCVLMNHNRAIKGNGFVESIDAQYGKRNQVRIVVTERKMTGCFLYGGKYWYTDSKGVVQASLPSLKEGDGIAPVTGLSLHTEPVIGEILPVSRTRVFVLLDTMRTLTDLYRIPPDEIRFDKNGSMDLIYKQVTVRIGDGTNLADRMEELAGILKVMDTSQAGTLHLENYDATQGQVIFDGLVR
ncbi:MAG: hypothetical protein VZR02_04925 [Lachnospiraceae bacterium]|nr:hypothetical protein [Lachnospiraceae bacterium]